ncbi:MAG: ubiquinone/menaquinone biosynthesis methyltransferase [Burkholderiales bacterium]|nr:ubiquinone/menaquinone biosynthesis methyltransferase [Anaerolineae bacterium]
MAHLKGKERAEYVQGMFGRIAKRYDLMNRLMTFGQDMSWRRFVVKQTKLPRGGKLLDLATGTGDIAFEALKVTPDLHAIGGDFALPMMHVGQTRELGSRVGWCGAEALNLPFPDNSFDAVTSGFLLRNLTAADIPRALSEQLRVLKSGGRVVTLDGVPPPPNLLRPFIDIQLRYVIPTMGRIIVGPEGADAYKYLPASIVAFKTPEELASLFRAAGFKNVQHQTFMLNTMVVVWGEK